MAFGTGDDRGGARRPRRWDRAVVIGGGYAGLLAARVLSETFARVTILERDRLRPGGGPRDGVPQAHHPHGMLAHGGQLLEALFPGLRGELAALKAPVFDFGTSYRTLLPTGWAPRTPLGIPLQSFSRPTLEDRLRSRVSALPGVHTLDGFHADGLVIDRGTNQARAVTGRRLSQRPSADSLTIEADLIVDATGHASRLPRWLEKADFPRPEQLVVDARLTYTSRLYRIPETGQRHDWLASVEAPYAPGVPRGGGILTVDGGRWIVCLIAAAGDLPPTDEAGFKEFAATLRNPDVAACVAEGTPLSRAHRYTHPGNRWTLFHKVTPWPDGLIALGDSVCTFNPVYGQGMTVAAAEATLLRSMVRQCATAGDPAGLAQRFQRRCARIVRVPWTLATGVDPAGRACRPSMVHRIARWYVLNLLAVLPDDPAVYRRFARVQHMLGSPAGLVHPAVLLRLLRAAPRKDALRPRPGPAFDPLPGPLSGPLPGPLPGE
ncbi:NAD(P)/FAD-dependent oxidoreductase [Streptomyces syringium]|uniref:NAD(P)/FAD-dependent oxidoreductase n=1 Tax=Streptomyces syringium TaxID=76729 RepID=UPI00367897DD